MRVDAKRPYFLREEVTIDRNEHEVVEARFLRLFLRFVGSVSLCAVFAVVMPYSWMNAIHQGLGLGELPDAPIVGYLARSTSALYAILGGLMWTLSFNVRQYEAVLSYLGAVIIVFGLTLLAVDMLEGLPFQWTISEGPANCILGTVILYCSRRLQ